MKFCMNANRQAEHHLRKFLRWERYYSFNTHKSEIHIRRSQDIGAVGEM